MMRFVDAALSPLLTDAFVTASTVQNGGKRNAAAVFRTYEVAVLPGLKY